MLCSRAATDDAYSHEWRDKGVFYACMRSKNSGVNRDGYLSDALEKGRLESKIRRN